MRLHTQLRAVEQSQKAARQQQDRWNEDNAVLNTTWVSLAFIPKDGSSPDKWGSNRRLSAKEFQFDKNPLQ